jgi:hypothetical protein
VSDFDKSPSALSQKDLSVSRSEASHSDITALHLFHDTSGFKYAPRSVKPSKVDANPASVAKTPEEDSGPIDAFVLRPENLTRLYGQEKTNVALHQSNTVDLFAPLVDQVRIIHLQPVSLFAKSQLSKLFDLRYDSTSEICQPWHASNIPSAAVCTRSYKNELPSNASLLEMVRARCHQNKDYKYALNVDDIVKHCLRGPRIDLFLLCVGNPPLGWKLYGCSGNSIRNDQQSSTGCGPTSNVRLVTVTDQDPLSPLNRNMDVHCAGRNILSVFFSDVIAGGKGWDLVHLYPYTTGGSHVTQVDTHEHLDSVVRFQKELFGEGVDRNFLNFRTGHHMWCWSLSVGPNLGLHEGGWKIVNVAYHGKRHLLLPYSPGTKSGDPFHLVLHHKSMSRESIIKLFLIDTTGALFQDTSKWGKF